MEPRLRTWTLFRNDVQSILRSRNFGRAQWINTIRTGGGGPKGKGHDTLKGKYCLSPKEDEDEDEEEEPQNKPTWEDFHNGEVEDGILMASTMDWKMEESCELSLTLGMEVDSLGLELVFESPVHERRLVNMLQALI